MPLQIEVISPSTILTQFPIHTFFSISLAYAILSQAMIPCQINEQINDVMKRRVCSSWVHRYLHRLLSIALASHIQSFHQIHFSVPQRLYRGDFA